MVSGFFLESNCSSFFIKPLPPFAVAPIETCATSKHSVKNERKMLKSGAAATVEFRWLWLAVLFSAMCLTMVYKPQTTAGRRLQWKPKAFSAFVEAPASRSARKSGAASLYENRSFHFQILNKKSFKPLSLQKNINHARTV